MVILNTAMFKLLFAVTQYDLLIQNYIKNRDSSKLSSLFVFSTNGLYNRFCNKFT